MTIPTSTSILSLRHPTSGQWTTLSQRLIGTLPNKLLERSFPQSPRQRLLWLAWSALSSTRSSMGKINWRITRMASLTWPCRSLVSQSPSLPRRANMVLLSGRCGIDSSSLMTQHFKKSLHISRRNTNSASLWLVKVWACCGIAGHRPRRLVFINTLRWPSLMLITFTESRKAGHEVQQTGWKCQQETTPPSC